MAITIVLWQPRIPQNVGNIARLAAATNARLHLVGDLGFVLSDRHLKRAGLDYWHLLDWQHFPDQKIYRDSLNTRAVSLLTTKAERLIYEHSFSFDEYIIFGAEDRGLPPDMLKKNWQHCYRLPIYNNGVRSLNLSNSVAITIFEALRQFKCKN